MSLQIRSWMVLSALVAGTDSAVLARDAVEPRPGVDAVWALDSAHRETTSTRERVSINGLWRWQPAEPTSDVVPNSGWGWFKVPGSWPGITDYMQKDCQTVHAHPRWKNQRIGGVSAAWYEREIAIAAGWTGRRITITAEYLNSYAVVYVDGERVGDMRFPAGEVDITAACTPGRTHVLSVLVVALPLKGVMLSYNDTNSAREVRGSVKRRGLCGDVWLVATPTGERVEEAEVETSVRRGEVTFAAKVLGAASGGPYTLSASVRADGGEVRDFSSDPFRASDLDQGRIAFTAKWRPKKLWDVHTPQHQLEVTLSLRDAKGELLDQSLPVRTGFREFWIDGRDFYLNGTRIFLCAVPLDNAQIGAAWASYDRARESLERLQSFGINAVYTHNYGCEPGSHLSFAEILRAADDVGMLASLSQPHFSQYDWSAPDADRSNGYAKHAEFYVRVAQNHPSVVMYSMNHNATGYNEDMNPDLIDGVHDARSQWSRRNAQRAVRAEAIVHGLDPDRIVYHHSSGNLGSMHTSNFYPNWVPIQEMCDWFEHWATAGVKPLFTVEYGAPFMWDWSMYRGWYKGARSFGSGAVPWEFCLAEWNAQFLGDVAFAISEKEKRNLRWEAERVRAGRVWHRWDYPHSLGSRDFDERYPILAAYLHANWRAFRTWGVSAISPWEHGVYWKMRAGLDRNRRVDLPTDWEHLQRPGFSPDYLGERYERVDLAYERGDWVGTPAAEALHRNNRPVLAYLAGAPGRFTGKDHNFLAGETVAKQIVVINNSRLPVTCECSWSLALPRAVSGTKTVRVETGRQARIPLRLSLPPDLKSGAYEVTLSARFRSSANTASGADETQEDQFTIHVMAPAPAVKTEAHIALFDPQGETGALLRAMGIEYRAVSAAADLSPTDLLIVGKAALTPEGLAPDLSRVRDGLRVLVFEQTAAALERRLGFRVAEYGLRNVFRRVPDHPVLAGLADEHLRDWRGEATIVPPRLDYELSDKYNGAPAVKWCGLVVPRLWRCGNRGNVASVLIEKPARGDFLPLVDGGFSLQYSPLLEYREGRGSVVFCQLDVTGRTAADPAATRLVANLLRYLASPSGVRPAPSRAAIYVGDPDGERHLESAGVSATPYTKDSLTADRVLVVGRGGGRALADDAPSVARWLAAGGHLLALELDAEEANAFSPTPIRTAKKEHIAAYFGPVGLASPLCGVGPADVHNREPRELPLVSGGAATLGDGVLAVAAGGHILYCQLVPYRVTAVAAEGPGFRRTYRRSAFLLSRLLANLGVRGETPLLGRFSTPLDADADAEGRWLSGLYVDTPREWDDPYRFFRW